MLLHNALLQAEHKPKVVEHYSSRETWIVFCHLCLRTAIDYLLGKWDPGGSIRLHDGKRQLGAGFETTASPSVACRCSHFTFAYHDRKSRHDRPSQLPNVFLSIKRGTTNLTLKRNEEQGRGTGLEGAKDEGTCGIYWSRVGLGVTAGSRQW